MMFSSLQTSMVDHHAKRDAPIQTPDFSDYHKQSFCRLPTGGVYILNRETPDVRAPKVHCQKQTNQSP